jgi:hypothetical protein
VSLAQVEAMVAEKCQPVAADQRKKTDFEWPPNSGKWHRPGPIFEAGVLGRRPTQGTNSVWSDSAFEAACRPTGTDPAELCRQGLLPEVGNDVAVFGDDWTTIHTRIGPVSLEHEAGNGWAPDVTAGRLKETCRRMAAWVNSVRAPEAQPVRPEDIKVKIELDGYGHGVKSHGNEWNWVGVSASGTAVNEEQFRNKRSELWFTTSERADADRLDLSRLPPTARSRLRQQCMMPTYTLNGAGQKEVEPKKVTKKRLKGRSPDDTDGMNLAYYETGSGDVATWIDTGERRSRRR